MKLADAEQLALETMRAWGLDNWSFGFDRARKRFGRCAYGMRRITLSRALVLLNDEPQVLDTIRHEVAHALVGPGVGHGPRWRAKAREVGAAPEACYSADNVIAAPARWYLECETCGYRHPCHRRPSRTYVHRKDFGRMRLVGTA